MPASRTGPPLVNRARRLISLNAHQGDYALVIIARQLDQGSESTNVRIDLDLVAITRSGASLLLQCERAKARESDAQPIV